MAERPLLLESLKKDFESNSCWYCSKKKLRVALGGTLLLLLALGAFLLVIFLTAHGIIQPTPTDLLCPEEDYTFVTIPLGVSGGTTENSLSSFLLSRRGSPYFIALDAGDLFRGLQVHLQHMLNEHYDEKQIAKFYKYPGWAVNDMQQAGWLMRNYVVGMLVGHPHLDHLMGLLATAPDNYYVDDNGNKISGSPKSIVGINETLSAISAHLFNGEVWANFVALGSFNYVQVNDETMYDLGSLVGKSINNSVPYTNFPYNTTVKVYKTCHDTLNSTAFLFQDKISNAQLVFFSDTGVPSSVSPSYCNWTQKIENVWADVDLRYLKAIFIEVSFPNDVPDSSMFGHLRPKDLIYLLQRLAQLHQVKDLGGLKIIVQHIKPYLGRMDANNYQSNVRTLIYNQLTQGNQLEVNFIMPNQGEPICI